MKRSAPLRRSSPPKKARAGTCAAKKRKATQLWGAWIHQRDVFCQRCGRGDGRMNAHHVMVREFAMTRADPHNGVLLCKKCHDVMHDDPLEAVKFYTARYGLEGYHALREKAYSGTGKTMREAHWDEAIALLQALMDALDGF